jgi:hypothetical protein
VRAHALRVLALALANSNARSPTPFMRRWNTMDNQTSSSLDETRGGSGQPTPPSIRPTGCCSRFDPPPFTDRDLTWDGESFVKEHVRCVFHVPLNFGSCVVRAQAKIDAAGARPLQPLMLSDKRSPCAADLHIRVTKPIPGAELAKLSGTYFTRVYEGRFSNAPKWASDMRGVRSATWQAARTAVLRVHDLPRVRESIRQELRGVVREAGLKAVDPSHRRLTPGSHMRR